MTTRLLVYLHMISKIVYRMDFIPIFLFYFSPRIIISFYKESFAASPDVKEPFGTSDARPVDRISSLSSLS